MTNNFLLYNNEFLPATNEHPSHWNMQSSHLENSCTPNLRVETAYSCRCITKRCLDKKQA